MDKNKLNWCCMQKSGIEIIEQKPHLNRSYIQESEKDAKAIDSADEKWKVIIGYYSCYEALYSILMQCGIKCEIHDCTIEMMDLFGFSEEDKKFIKNLKKLREENQYYLKRNPIDKSEILRFTGKCKEILNNLNDDNINNIRSKIKELTEGKT